MTRRLVGSYLALTILVLIALEIPLAVTYRDRQQDQLEAGLERDAFVLSAFVEDTLNGSAQQDLQTVVANYQADTSGRAVIVDQEAEVLADSDPAVDGARSFASRPEIAQALGGEVAVGTRRSDTLGTGLVYVAVPVGSGENPYGAVRLSYSTDQLDTRVRRYWLLLTGAAAVTLVVAAAAGALLARWVTRPLADLQVAATKIGDGDLDTRARSDQGPPEVQALADAFNTTARRLDQLVTAQEQFVADASHQLRTPLTALRLRLEMLEADPSDPASVDLDAARSEVMRLSRLVDGLLTLARAERAPGPPTEAAVALGAELEERLTAWEPVAAERDVRLVIDPQGHEHTVTAATNPDHLGQVLDNLIANAIEASPTGSTVSLRAESQPASARTGHARNGHAERVEIHVVDEGPGMTAEQRAHAFDRFWRATASRPDSELGGSGLGLAIVQKLVEADGGHVELREAAGGGLDAVVVLRR